MTGLLNPNCRKYDISFLHNFRRVPKTWGSSSGSSSGFGPNQFLGEILASQNLVTSEQMVHLYHCARLAEGARA